MSHSVRWETSPDAELVYFGDSSLTVQANFYEWLSGLHIGNVSQKRALKWNGDKEQHLSEPANLGKGEHWLSTASSHHAYLFTNLFIVLVQPWNHTCGITSEAKAPLLAACLLSTDASAA